jgi:hypothetical protein
MPQNISAAASNMADDLATDIKDTQAELKDVREEIIKLNKRLDENDFTGTVRYSSQEKVEAALSELKAKETQLNNRLDNLYDTRKITLTQQQESGAGTSMLPVRQEDVILPGKGRAACTSKACSFQSVFCCQRFRSCTAAMTHCKLENKYAVQCIAHLLMCISSLLLMLCVRCCARIRSASRYIHFYCYFALHVAARHTFGLL